MSMIVAGREEFAMLPMLIHRWRVQQPETRTFPVLLAAIGSALAVVAGLLLLVL
jgi:hypothetical protein